MRRPDLQSLRAAAERLQRVYDRLTESCYLLACLPDGVERCEREMLELAEARDLLDKAYDCRVTARTWKKMLRFLERHEKEVKM